MKKKMNCFCINRIYACYLLMLSCKDGRSKISKLSVFMKETRGDDFFFVEGREEREGEKQKEK